MTRVWPEAVPSVFDDLCRMAAKVASGQVKHADIHAGTHTCEKLLWFQSIIWNVLWLVNKIPLQREALLRNVLNDDSSHHQYPFKKKAREHQS